MNHTLVIDFDQSLLSLLNNRKIVVRTNNLNLINTIYNAIEKNNTLHSIWLESDLPFTSIPFDQNHAGIPLAVFPAGFGAFKELIANLDLLKKLNLRVYLSSDNEETLAALNVLSSLGIYSGIIFGNKTINWEKTNDLMHYAIFSRASHAPVEPFHYVVTNYGKNYYTCYNAVYFNNPSEFLHVNENQQIAFTREEYVRGDYFATGLNALNSLQENEPYTERMKSWQKFFLQAEGCAYCPSWRVCLGKFSDRSNDHPGCRDFFSDLIDASYLYSSIINNGKEKIWQP